MVPEVTAIVCAVVMSGSGEAREESADIRGSIGNIAAVEAETCRIRPCTIVLREKHENVL